MAVIVDCLIGVVHSQVMQVLMLLIVFGVVKIHSHIIYEYDNSLSAIYTSCAPGVISALLSFVM